MESVAGEDLVLDSIRLYSQNEAGGPGLFAIVTFEAGEAVPLPEALAAKLEEERRR